MWYFNSINTCVRWLWSVLCTRLHVHEAHAIFHDTLSWKFFSMMYYASGVHSCRIPVMTSSKLLPHSMTISIFIHVEKVRICLYRTMYIYTHMYHDGMDIFTSHIRTLPFIPENWCLAERQKICNRIFIIVMEIYHTRVYMVLNARENFNRWSAIWCPLTGWDTMYCTLW